MKTLSTGASVEAIDRELASGLRRLRFQAGVEREYEADIADQRRRHLTIASLMGIVLYDLFLFNDKLMVPDVFREALVLRLCIFTPLALGFVWLIRKRASFKILDICGTLVSVLSVGLIMVLVAKSGSPHRQGYQYGTALIMIFVSVAQRLTFGYCLLAVAVMFTIQSAGSAGWGGLDPTALHATITFHASVGLLVLFTAYGLEREFRRSYLLRMRGHLLNERLDRAAKIDPLTGLFNRRHLNDIMAETWAATSTAAPRAMAMILLDLDHFKSFNDTYGHLAGDECLRKISACIRATVGEIAVRFGGEEFLIFLPDVGPDEAHRIATRLCAAIASEAIPHPVLGDDAMVTASIGIGTGEAPSVSISSLLASADAALYAAKAAGRDCIWLPLAEGGRVSKNASKSPPDQAWRTGA